jgi:hypothetical protein
MKALSCAALVLALAGMGCTTQTIPGPLVVSTRPLPELATSGATAKRVTGESCSRTVLLVIPIGFATAESAYADAVEQAPGADTLVNYEERATSLFIFPFYFEVCTEIHGDAVSSKSKSSAPDSEPAPKSNTPDSEPAP